MQDEVHCDFQLLLKYSDPNNLVKKSLTTSDNPDALRQCGPSIIIEADFHFAGFVKMCLFKVLEAYLVMQGTPASYGAIEGR